MGSPIDSWEGAAAIFTGANSSFSIGVCLLIAVVLTVLPLIDSARHEGEVYKKSAEE